MNKVTIEFKGHKAAEMAEKLYIYLVDGGLEDVITQNLSDDETIIDGFAEIDTFHRKAVFKCVKHKD